MDGLNAESGPKDNAGTPSNDDASLDDAITAAMAEWPQTSDQTGQESVDDAPAGEDMPADGPSEAETTHSQQTNAQPTEPDKGILEAPQHWSKDERDAFAKIQDQAARQLVLERDKAWQKGFTQKTQEMSHDRKLAGEVRSLFSDAERNELQQRGMSEAQVIQGYRQLDALYRQNPLQYIQLVMQQAGIKPEQLQSQPGQTNGQAQPQQASDDDWEDPEIQALKSQLQELRQEVGTTRQEWNSWTTQQRQNHSANAIRHFASSQDEAGNPRYPHFNEAQEKMAWVMQNHNDLAQMAPSVEKLEKAYERVMQLDPHYRQLNEQRMREEMEKKFSADRTRAASTPRPKPGASAQVAPTSDNLDDIISQAMKTAVR